MNLRASLLGIFALLVALAPAHSAVVIDQNQPLVNTFAVSMTTPEIVQSFQPGANNVAGAGVRMEGCCGEGVTELTLSLWTNLPSAGGVQLASGTGGTDNSTWVGAPDTRWVDAFWTPVTVLPGSTLYLLIESSDGKFGLSGNACCSFGSDVYPNGNAYVSGSSAGVFLDFTFRTFAENGVSAVPEPATWLMMILGSCGLGFMAHRRKSKPVLMAA